MKNLFFRFSAITAMGFSAGLLGGLFGTGGGILIVFPFSRIYAGSGEYGEKDCFAMTLAVTLLFSCVSLCSYIKNGVLCTGDFSPRLLPAALGGLAGAFLLDRLNTALLRKIFAGLVIYAGLSLIVR